MALRRGAQAVRLQDITEGVRRELRKDGKVIEDPRCSIAP